MAMVAVVAVVAVVVAAARGSSTEAFEASVSAPTLASRWVVSVASAAKRRHCCTAWKVSLWRVRGSSSGEGLVAPAVKVGL